MFIAGTTTSGVGASSKSWLGTIVIPPETWTGWAVAATV